MWSKDQRSHMLLDEIRCSFEGACVRSIDFLEIVDVSGRNERFEIMDL
jgi:hypothetical protein